jgi:hypothetical protein
LESTSGTRTPRLLYIPRCVYVQTHCGFTRIWRVLQEGLAECIANENGERQIACAIAFHGEEIVRPGSLYAPYPWMAFGLGMSIPVLVAAICGLPVSSASVTQSLIFFFLAVCGQPSYASTS